MTSSRYVLTDADVVLELTAQQTQVVLYVLRRAQEDPEFLVALTGSADSSAVGVLRATLTRVITQIEAVT